MTKTFIILTFLFAFFNTSAQVDSLKKALTEGQLTDNDRVKILDALSRAFWREGGENWDSAATYAEHAYKLATQLNSSEDIARALIKKAVVQDVKGHQEKALNYFAKAQKIAQQHGYKEVEAEVYDNTGILYQQWGQRDSALLYYKKSIKLYENLQLKEHVLRIKSNLAFILQRLNKHQELAELYASIIPEFEKNRNHFHLIRIYSYMAINFKDMNEEEKALLYAEKALNLIDSVDDKATHVDVYQNMGSVVGYYKDFKRAEMLFNKSLELARELNNKRLENTNLSNLSEIYFSHYKDFKKAEAIIDQLIRDTSISVINANAHRLKGQILYENGNHLAAINHFDKAYNVFQKMKDYTHMRRLLNLKIKSRLAAIGDEQLITEFDLYVSLYTKFIEDDNKKEFIELETKYRTAEKEAEIQKKELELSKSRNRILMMSGVALLLLGAGVFSVWFVNNRQKRKELEHANQVLKLQHNINAVELANLNNQLNPHEIKNLITSIAPEIISKAPDAYKKMIKLFNVTRASLSNKLTESIATQMIQTEDFLQLQQSISPYRWEYEIKNEIEQIEVELPRLLLKNLAENAVKHGLKSVRENGKICISVSRENKYIKINVKDNGGGIEGKINTESTGIGLSTYKKLFDFMNTQNEQHAVLTLSRKEGWTIAELSLPSNYKYHSQ